MVKFGKLTEGGYVITDLKTALDRLFKTVLSLLPQRRLALNKAAVPAADDKVASAVKMNSSGTWKTHPDRPRISVLSNEEVIHKVVAVDEDLGIALMRMNFGDTGSYGPGNSLHIFEAFKVYGGQIHAVEAFMKVMPA